MGCTQDSAGELNYYSSDPLDVFKGPVSKGMEEKGEMGRK